MYRWEPDVLLQGCRGPLIFPECTPRKDLVYGEGAEEDRLPFLGGILNVSGIQKTCRELGGVVADYYIST